MGAFYIYLDTSDTLVCSGSEDCLAYIWDKKFGCLLGTNRHDLNKMSFKSVFTQANCLWSFLFLPSHICIFFEIFFSVSRLLVHVWKRHENVVNSVAFNPVDQQTLVTVGDDHKIKIWMSKQKVRESSCQFITHNTWGFGQCWSNHTWFFWLPKKLSAFCKFYL